MPGSEIAHSQVPSPLVAVFVRALLLAEGAGASEIGIDHLLAALSAALLDERSSAPSVGPFVPTPKRQMFFSSAAQAALESAGSLEQVSIDSLRSALSVAKREDSK
jgi:hypothetical protein